MQRNQTQQQKHKIASATRFRKQTNKRIMSSLWLTSLLYAWASLSRFVDASALRQRRESLGDVVDRPRRLQSQLVTHTYPEESPPSVRLLNPERGFYTQRTYSASKRATTLPPLNANDLRHERDTNGVTTILRLFYLDEFLESDISPQVLQDIADDFDVLREAGFKAVLRFAYVDSFETVPSEPDKDQLLRHVEQLTPVLTASQDVIVSMQAGFVGPWGEWHGSTHFAEGSPGYWDDLGEILKAVLDAVPQTTVQIRTPALKKAIFARLGPSLQPVDRVTNGDMEGDNTEDTWFVHGNGYQRTTDEARSGQHSLRVTNGAAKQWVPLDVSSGSSITISGYSKAIRTQGDATDSGSGNNIDYSIFADVQYADGTFLWAQAAMFSGSSSSEEDENGWEYASHSFLVPPEKTVTGLTLYTMYQNDPLNRSPLGPPPAVGGENDLIDTTITYDPTCVDDPAFVYREKEGKDCAWLLGRTDRVTQIICKTRASKRGWGRDKKRVHEYCKATCYAAGINHACEGPAMGAYFDDVAVTVDEGTGAGTGTSSDALNANTALDGSYLARTGHHNDCFLATPTDLGTYSDATQSEYPYLSQETQYTAMGGETCQPNLPRSGCATALEEMNLFHYSYLSRGHHLGVLDNFANEGCLDEMKAHLGYRLVLRSGSFPDAATPGGNLPFEIRLDNVGYAAPLHAKNVQLVWRSADTLCATDGTLADARQWWGGGNAHALAGAAVLPTGMPPGTYSLYLHIADDNEALQTRVDYKIKVANSGAFNDPDTGLISLQHSMTIQEGGPTWEDGGDLAVSVRCGVEADILPDSARDTNEMIMPPSP